jgi:hypothetical protein
VALPERRPLHFHCPFLVPRVEQCVERIQAAEEALQQGLALCQVNDF